MISKPYGTIMPLGPLQLDTYTFQIFRGSLMICSSRAISHRITMFERMLNKAIYSSISAPVTHWTGLLLFFSFSLAESCWINSVGYVRDQTSWPFSDSLTSIYHGTDIWASGRSTQKWGDLVYRICLFFISDWKASIPYGIEMSHGTDFAVSFQYYQSSALVLRFELCTNLLHKYSRTPNFCDWAITR